MIYAMPFHILLLNLRSKALELILIAKKPNEEWTVSIYLGRMVKLIVILAIKLRNKAI